MKKSDTALARWTKERSPFSGYKFTVTNREDPALLRLKEVVKKSNQEHSWGNKLRVSLMGRGPRVRWARVEGKHPRAYDSYLPLDKATHYDVYVHEAPKYYNA